ncbi:MAG: zinc metallopeptidase [Candidatus Dojkabacteria bacterium]|nr:zinc metallopeptidase [Candidatus Dojkabacteria bacterium]MDQ7021441.1 zinc metallopeptidase [Candidatus Dojkabacteria bacterium]
MFLYLLFVLPGLIIGLYAQFLLKRSYGKFSKISAGTSMTGMQAAKLINDSGNFGVSFQTTEGQLNDYFDPKNNLVNLSSDNAVNDSVANIAVVAHEFGHVQQKQVGQSLFKLRSTIVPVVSFGSGVGYVLIMIGLMIASSGLAWVGIILFSTVTVFSLVTLPVELDASRRAMKLIEKHGLIAPSHYGGAKVVLRAAALTYFAGLVQSLGQLAYFVMLVSSNNRRD